jgi:glycosyltransferase involved in cell wall biosynthesis
MTKPYLSIIIPTLNVSSTIQRTLDSIKKQLFNNYECIIVDSNSLDNTMDIVYEYSHCMPIIYISEYDKGISDAFNKGVKLSNGKWILFLGSGDELVDEYVLEKAVNFLTIKEKSYFVWGNILYKNIDGNIGKRVSGNHHPIRLRQYMCYHHQSIFHNRLLFQHYGYFNTDIKIAMDYDMILRLYRYCNINDYIDMDISFMLIGGNSQLSYNATIKDFRDIQIGHKLWPKSIANLIYYWSLFKYKIKLCLNINSYGV